MLKKTMLLAVTACISASASGCGGAAPAVDRGGASAEPLRFSVAITDVMNKYIFQSPDINKDKWVLKLNEMANAEITFRYLDHKKLDEQIKLMLLSGDITDVVVNYGYWHSPVTKKAVESGMFARLDEILDKNKGDLPNLMSAITQKVWDESETDDGKLFGIPFEYNSAPLSYATYVRKDLLDKYSLPVPSTIEEFTRVLRAFKENGMEYPYCGRENWSYSELFIAPFGVSINRFNLNGEGKMLPDIIRPEFKEAVAFNRTLREEGLMNPQSPMINSFDWRNKIRSGEVGMFMHDLNALSTWDLSLKSNVPDGEFILIPSPLGPRGNRGGAVAPTVVSTWFINSNFHDIPAILRFLDFTARDGVGSYFSLGTENEGEYKAPVSELDVDERNFRRSLAFVRDNSFNKFLLPFEPKIREMVDFTQRHGNKEGYRAYRADPLVTLEKRPELLPGASCALWQDYMAKIFFGRLPVSAYDDFIDEYLNSGGAEVIEEATRLYQEGKLTKY
jgi:putative aldouronate transport system substrate-binding protein